jgi:hypothetical protein
MPVVFKVTFPNGKIYVGKDMAGEINYLGSNDPKIIQQDFTKEELRDVTLRKETLWESDTASNKEVCSKEIEFITVLKSNDPAIGYNRFPKFRG